MTFNDIASIAGCKRRGCEITSQYDALRSRTTVTHGNHPEGTLTINDEELRRLPIDVAGPNVLDRLMTWGKSIHDYEDGKLSYLSDIATERDN